MQQATYRGVKYDTATPKQEYKEWHELVDGKDHVYRGKTYQPLNMIRNKLLKEKRLREAQAHRQLA